ncbi:MAG: redoxin domain-containing protein [Bacteroidales bacterium]|nr:redoxin domain-containing protein [Bacteroidales bacterium]
MKKKILTTVFLITGFLFLTLGQKSVFPDADLLTLDGKTIQSTELFKGESPIILVFWKTYEKDCCKHISSLIEAHEDLLDTVNARLVCICVDCIGQTHHIKPFVDGNGWDCEVYIDKNGEFKRAMAVNNTPYTILYYNQKIICRYNGYCSGTEDMICTKLKHCLALND